MALSARATRAVLAPQTGEIFVVLLTLDHPDFGVPVRVCSDSYITTSRGDPFAPFPFLVELPNQDDASPPTVTLRIDNIDRQIVAKVRQVDSGTPISVMIEVALASTPDTVEAGPFIFDMRDVSYDAQHVEGTLAYEDVLNEPYPGVFFTPSVSPGLF